MEVDSSISFIDPFDPCGTRSTRFFLRSARSPSDAEVHSGACLFRS